MNSKLVNAMMFAAGAVIGTAATWQYWKTKYEKIAQEEIESVKEAFSKKQADEDTKPKDVEETDVRNDNTCIGKCKDRHDEEIDPRIKCVFQTVRHADRVVIDITHAAQTVALRTIRKGDSLLKLVIVVSSDAHQVFFIASVEVGTAEPSIHRNHECHNHA